MPLCKCLTSTRFTSLSFVSYFVFIRYEILNRILYYFINSIRIKVVPLIGMLLN